MTRPYLCVILATIFSLAAATEALAGTPLRVGDHVTIKVYNHPELSGDVTVDSDGTVVVPLAGAVSVAGVDPATAAARVRASLGRYVRNASVEIDRKTEGAAITVSGWPFAISDGVVKYLPGQTLAGAIASIRTAGQGQPQMFDPFHSRINMRAVRVARDGRVLGPFDLVAMTSAGEAGPLLRPGDEVRFANKPIVVRVRGDVKQPGYAYLAADEPLSEALEQANGLADGAATSNIVLTRRGVSQEISLADDAFHEPAQSDDTLYIATAPQVVVAGTVQHPGTVMLRSDQSLLAAVFNAGGPEQTGDLGQVRVIRAGVVSKYDLTAVARGDFTQNPQLRDGDQVYITRGRRIDSTVFAQTLAALRGLVFRY